MRTAARACFLGKPEGEDEDHAVSKVEPAIRYDHTIMDRFESARRELKEHIKNSLNTKQTIQSYDNPVKIYMPGL